MPKKTWTFALRVRGVTPDGLPMARLGEYMREFAELLGQRQNIHFAGVVRGSAVLRATVSEPQTTDVTKRVLGARTGDAPKDVSEHADRIDRFMREDRAYGEIIRHDGNVIYAFEGARRKSDEQPEVFVTQEGELTGVVLRIGGKDDTVPLLLEGDGGFYEVNVKGREQARSIAAYLFGKSIRVFGNGTWKRGGDGQWRLSSFMVHSFVEVDDRPLSDVINELRAIQGNGWSTIENPVAEWERLRSG